MTAATSRDGGTFRLGLIGAGRMGRTHLRAIYGSAVVTAVAAAEPSGPARQDLATTGLPVYASVAELLDRADLDGVLIAAPSDRHLEIIAEVAACGLPILCEKPCGLTAEQAGAAARTAADAGVPLQVAYWRRYVPALRAARERIAAGDVGGLHLVTCYQWDESPPAAAFRAHSGGIAIDMGVHEFDQLRWLSGQEITGIQAVAAGLMSDPGVTGDVDSAQIIASLSGGATGFISLGRHHPAGDMVRAEVFGTAGTISCDVIDPADGERAQLDALRRQAEGFAAFARGQAAGTAGAAGAATAGVTTAGATAADAVAALRAAGQASAAIPALAATRPRTSG
ncbi:MAG TPA: Gfo/Idh/MocA family oxidoreductase [Streptosporangiaceae bacterium]|nr:Gfo/Idh/MocA family oxidoreductase [Streptosporangiaceae bacterium]